LTRGPSFWTGCCRGFIGRRMAQVSSAVGTILMAGESAGMTAGHRPVTARMVRRPCYSELMKIGTKPSQVNAEA
jgi:hypothetical protein